MTSLSHLGSAPDSESSPRQHAREHEMPKPTGASTPYALVTVFSPALEELSVLLKELSLFLLAFDN